MVRVKNRYIVVQIVPDRTSSGKTSFNDYALTKCLIKNIQKYYGDVGVGSVEHGLRIKYCNDETKVTIIRCRHRAHRFVTSILPLITVIGEHRAKFHILYIGATVIQCNKFIVRYQKNYLNKIACKIESGKAKIDFAKNVMDFLLE